MFILYNYDICANNMLGYLIIKYLHYLVDILTCSKWKKKVLTLFYSCINFENQILEGSLQI